MISAEYDPYFLIIGKALYVGIEFESDVRVMSTYLSLKKPLFALDNEKALEEFCNKISAFSSTRNRLKKVGVHKDLQGILNAAIKSRNYIVHELTLGIEYLQSDEPAIKQFVEIEIQPNVLNILKADLILKGFLSRYINKEDGLSSQWIADSLRWVSECEE